MKRGELKYLSGALKISIVILFLITSIQFVYALPFGISLKNPLAPEILIARVYPLKVMPGDELLISIIVQDNFGIKIVKAEIEHEEGYDTLQLGQVEGTAKGGTYKAEWQVHDTKERWYDIIITATNKLGITSQIILQYYDPTVSHNASQITTGNFTGPWYNFNNTLHINSTSGNVGIGTTSPNAPLEVLGSANISGPVNISAGKFRIDSSGNINTTGTLNTSVLYMSGGNVGIGTTAPSEQLTVASAGKIAVYRSGNDRRGVLYTDGSGTKLESDSGGNDPLYLISPGTAGTINFVTSTTEKMRLNALGGLSLGNTYLTTDPGAGSMIVSGSVGIGTTGPGAKLEVNGDVNITGKMNVTSTARFTGNITAKEDITLDNNTYIYFGDGNNIKMYYDGSSFIIAST